MAGIEIDGVNNKIDFDDDKDTSISANVDDTLVIESGGANIASITSGEFAINDDQANIDFRVESDLEHSMLFVDASQHSIGVATGNPAIASGRGIVVDGGSSVARVELRNDTSGDTASDGMFLTYSGTDAFVGNREAGTIQFWNNGSERMRIDNDGDLFFATTLVNPNPGIYLNNAGQMNIGNNNGTNGQDFLIFRRNASNIGSVVQDGTTGVTYLSSSDYRLKENVETEWNATSRLKQLKPSRFNFISDPDRTVDGFLAHEVSDIVPEATKGEKDATETKLNVVLDYENNIIAENVEEADWIAGKIPNEEGSSLYPENSLWEESKVVPIFQQMENSKLVPLLVKTVQELEARITELENA